MRVSLFFVFLSLLFASSFGAQVADEFTGNDVCFLMAISLRHLLKNLWAAVMRCGTRSGKKEFYFKDIFDYMKEHKLNAPVLTPLLQLLEEIRDDPKIAAKKGPRLAPIENVLDSIIVSSGWDEVYNQIVPDSIEAHMLPLVLKYVLPKEDLNLLTNGNYKFSATEKTAFYLVKSRKLELEIFFVYFESWEPKILAKNLQAIADTPDRVMLNLATTQEHSLQKLKKTAIGFRKHLLSIKNENSSVGLVRNLNFQANEPFQIKEIVNMEPNNLAMFMISVILAALLGMGSVWMQS